MNAPLSYRANLVSELQSRLAEAMNDEDADFIAGQLVDAGGDLERSCLAALREARQSEAYAEALKTIIADNRARKERLEARAEKIRAAVAQAMAEAGLPKIVSADMTVSFRMGKAPLIIDREPELADEALGWADAKVTYTWKKDFIRKQLEAGGTSEVFRLGNPAPVLTLRGK